MPYDIEYEAIALAGENDRLRFENRQLQARVDGMANKLEAIASILEDDTIWGEDQLEWIGREMEDWGLGWKP